MPVVVLNVIVLGRAMYEKSFAEMFYPLVNFDAPGEPLGQSSTVLKLIYSRLNLSMFQISSGADNLCIRYLLPNFVGFVDSVTDKQ